MIDYRQKLLDLAFVENMRELPMIQHQGRWIIRKGGQKMLNLSSNDYLGIASDSALRHEFLHWAMEQELPLSSSSSRLLTGNFSVYADLEQLLAKSYGREAALVFNSGYHANTGILQALTDKHDIVIADKLVHASLIDGMILSGATFFRYRHLDYDHLEYILEKELLHFERAFIVTESIFSMDGDVADLPRLVALKRKYPNVMLYVDEAHAVGVRGRQGLGVAEESGCIMDIDLLVGTFGKSMASLGAFVVCNDLIRSYLVNTMRPLIFSTALPPLQVAWTSFLFRRLPAMQTRREHLRAISQRLAKALAGWGGEISNSHIVPCIVGENKPCVWMAEQLQRKGFYCLPVRPPTVPHGTSRIRFSLTADMEEEEIYVLLNCIEECADDMER